MKNMEIHTFRIIFFMVFSFFTNFLILSLQTTSYAKQSMRAIGGSGKNTQVTILYHQHSILKANDVYKIGSAKITH